MKTNMKKVWLVGLVAVSLLVLIIGVILFLGKTPKGNDTQQTESENETLTDTSNKTEESQTETETSENEETKDKVAPVISLAGNQNITIYQGATYQEPGYTASDDTDGDISALVTVEGSVDGNTVGEYEVIYRVTDSSGNVAEIKRTIQVLAQPTAQGDKIIYLTFDDGPSAYTEKLLDVLDEYGVKATFFVTNCQPQYQHMIGEAYRRGHTIALHTAYHMYSNYASKEQYYSDLEIIHAIVLEETGQNADLIRFPGGSSNSVSKKYCEGIMTFLTQDVANHGYRYCDWNVSSGDGNSSITTDAVITNVIGGVSSKNVSVVLQHDTVESSVEAVDDIIRWGLENGYTFLPMTEDTQMVHHSVSN